MGFKLQVVLIIVFLLVSLTLLVEYIVVNHNAEATIAELQAEIKDLEEENKELKVKEFDYLQLYGKLKVCPEEWFLDQMPAINASKKLESFLVNGKRRNSEDFDLEWIKENCEVSEPKITR